MDSIALTPQLVVLVLAAISFGALIKGMTGLGLPMFAVPALATFMSVEEAVVLMVIPGIAANLMLIITHRQHSPLLKQHLPFLVAGVAGAFAGTWLLQNISDQWLRVVLAIWLGQYLIRNFSRKELLPDLRVSRKMGSLLGLFAGTSQGASGISAQVVAPYYHSQRLNTQAYAFVVAASFLLFSLSQFTAMTAFDLFTAKRFKLTLFALIPTLIFIQIGIAQAKRIPAASFNKFLLILFLLMEIKLISDIL